MSSSSLFQASLLSSSYSDILKISNKFPSVDFREDWNLWRMIAERDFSTPPEFFDLISGREITGFERYLEIASSFNLLPEMAASVRSGQVCGLVESSLGFLQGLVCANSSILAFFFPRLKEEVKQNLSFQVNSGQIVGEKGNFVTFSHLVTYLMGEEAIQKIPFPSRAQLAVELNEFDLISNLFDCSDKTQLLLEMVENGNGNAFDLLMQGEKNEELALTILRSGNLSFLRRFVQSDQKIWNKDKAIGLLSELEHTRIEINCNARNLMPETIKPESAERILAACQSSNWKVVDFVSQLDQVSVIDLTEINYSERLFSILSNSSILRKKNPVGLYWIISQIPLSDFPPNFWSNQIEVLEYLSSFGLNRGFLERILFSPPSLAQVQNLQVYLHYLKKIDNVEEVSREFLQKYSTLLPLTCKIIRSHF
ncbi:hypothetical protein pv_282 [Pithovirus sibericum]|uniref:Uncharacterized protein n=1 Tax=Pithovirus sibericum TaxID=1450746 RepID=W5S5A6_9VIRU|nr:hypothetical protein pv_282 [Pithovirus sibericum]AHH01849.1 hypothetical protein pv_282 [Pithovirus sibericum]